MDNIRTLKLGLGPRHAHSILTFQARDVFQSFVNPKNLRLLETGALIKPLTEEDWEAEDLSGLGDLLAPTLRLQKTCLIAHCELALKGRFNVFACR